MLYFDRFFVLFFSLFESMEMRACVRRKPKLMMQQIKKEQTGYRTVEKTLMDTREEQRKNTKEGWIMEIGEEGKIKRRKERQAEGHNIQSMGSEFKPGKKSISPYSYSVSKNQKSSLKVVKSNELLLLLLLSYCCFLFLFFFECTVLAFAKAFSSEGLKKSQAVQF